MVRGLPLAVLCLAAVPVLAQESVSPEQIEIIRSLGQPPILRGSGFLSVGSFGNGDIGTTGHLNLGLQKPFLNPAAAVVYLGRQPGGAGANVPGLRGAEAQDRAVQPQCNLVPAPEILCLRTSMPPGTTDAPGQAHWRQTLSCNELDGRFWRSC